MSFFGSESTGRAHQNIDEMLQENMEAAHGERLAREGSIGTIPEKYPLPGGLTEEDLLDMVTGSYGGITKTGGSVLAKLAKGIKGSKLGKKAIGAVKRKLNTSKAFQNWWGDTTPTKLIGEVGERGRSIATEDIAGKGGFERFLHTIDAPKSMNTPKMQKAFEGLIRPRMKAANLGKMSRKEKNEYIKAGARSPAGFAEVQGYSQQHLGAPAEVRIADYKRGLKTLFGITPERLKSTAVHEFTHVGQMPAGFPGVAYMDKFAKQYKLSPKQIKLFEDALWPAADNPSTFWRAKYAEKIRPFVRPQHKITDDMVTGVRGTGNSPAEYAAYHLQPHEISARAASIRNLLKKTIPRRLYKGSEDWVDKEATLKDLMARELPYMDIKGVDYAVKNLWGMGPLGLAFQGYEDKK
jgi:hypothetical protein